MNSTRVKYKAQGLCVKCGGIRDVTSRLHCANCLASGRAAEKRSYHKYRETRRTYHRKWKKVNSVELKAAAYKAYGGYRCFCCDETQEMFLTLDHINNDGAAHRKEIGEGTRRLYEWLKKNNYPEGLLRVSCQNCNSGRYRNGGICPHEVERESSS